MARRRLGALATAGLLLAVLPLAADTSARDGAFDAQRWREAFARPGSIPEPVSNPGTPEKIALGRALFEDKRLSGSGEIACATCHQQELAFSDGVALHTGLDGAPLPRRTPPIWNAAWGLTFFWDGRATSLEEQAPGPVGAANEMGGDLSRAALRFGEDADLVKKFAAAFPDDPQVSGGNVAKALAAYERTLVSPKTRFDAWVEGDDKALNADELAGFQLFVGKAQCVSCHSGWRFTDESFHDIGLKASQDRGRGAAINLHAADHAFKTPSLRERVWTAPYMHDGSVASLEEAVAHYSGGIERRRTLSRDLDPDLRLTAKEQGEVVAFLATLSSDDPPRPASAPRRIQQIGARGGELAATTVVGQKGRRFTPGAVRIDKGATLTIVNDDTRVHNVRGQDASFNFASDAQEPGDQVQIQFPGPGEYDLICGIHPDMRLHVVVPK